MQITSGHPEQDHVADGILPDILLQQAYDNGLITSASALDADQIQPASMDLRLGTFAYRLRASFLPGQGRGIGQRLTDSDLCLYSLDLTKGAVLEAGCVYLVPLQEALALPATLSGRANPKSSTGRIDVFVRVITDGAEAFDQIGAGYHGQLWAEVCPRTFSIHVRPGDRLCQMRLRQGPAHIVKSEDLTLDLDPNSIGALVGWRARRHAPVLDLSKISGHEADRWFEPIGAQHGKLVLDPGEFYILASARTAKIAPDFAAEMVATAEDLGEFRAHYAGFFDPGFGGENGARAVLEVRGRDVPFILEHGQKIARLTHEKLAQPPEKIYGEGGSHYQGQDLKLAKFFKV